MRAKIGSRASAFLPVMKATASAPCAPAGMQRFGGTSGFVTTASAYCSHPANPQAPQCAWARTSFTCSTFGLIVTENFFAAKASAEAEYGADSGEKNQGGFDHRDEFDMLFCFNASANTCLRNQEMEYVCEREYPCDVCEYFL